MKAIAAVSLALALVSCGGTSPGGPALLASTTVATEAATAIPRVAPTATSISPPTSIVPTIAEEPFYANCAAVRAAGKAPLRRGQPGYRAALDRDGDGIACE